MIWAAVLLSTVHLPGPVMDVRVEGGVILTVEAGTQGRDLVAVRDEHGEMLLGPLAPAPSDLPVRHIIVGDVALWGADRVVVSVWYKLPLDTDMFGLAFLDLRSPGKEPEFHDTGTYFCESVASAPEGGLWCAGYHAYRQHHDYGLLRRLDKDLNTVSQGLPRSAFGDTPPRLRLLPGPGGRAALWLPTARVLCDVSDGAPPACRHDLPGGSEGHPLASMVLAPTGAPIALLPKDGEPDSFSTPYVFYGVAPDGQWMPLRGWPEQRRGVTVAGCGKSGLALWDRSKRTISYLDFR